MTPPSIRTRRTHERIRSTALELFVTQGYDATSVSQIAAAASVSRRTFFNHFATKNEVVLGRFERYGERFAEQLERARNDLPPLLATRRAVIDVLRAEIDEAPDTAAMIELIRGSDQLAASTEKGLKHYEHEIRNALERALSPDSIGELYASVLATIAVGTASAAVQQWIDAKGARACSSVADDLFSELFVRLRSQRSVLDPRRSANAPTHP